MNPSNNSLNYLTKPQLISIINKLENELSEIQENQNSKNYSKNYSQNYQNKNTYKNHYQNQDMYKPKQYAYKSLKNKSNYEDMYVSDD